MDPRRTVVGLVLVASLALAASAPAAGEGDPRLDRFKAGGRIASGVVARYDLREESRDFEYRIRAERIEVRVTRKTATGWTRVGSVVRTRPPRPLNFWPVFRRMGTGTYRLVARAVNGRGEQREQSAPRTIRFRVVRHIPHAD